MNVCSQNTSSDERARGDGLESFSGKYLFKFLLLCDAGEGDREPEEVREVPHHLHQGEGLGRQGGGRHGKLRKCVNYVKLSLRFGIFAFA